MVIQLVFIALTSLMLITISHYSNRKELVFTLKTSGYILLGLLVYLLHLQGLIDETSTILGLAFTSLSYLISLYSAEYTSILGYEKPFEVSMEFFLITIVLTYVAPTFLLFVVAWTLSEILGFIVIRKGEEHSLEGPLTSSRGFILTSTLTYEISIFTLIALAFMITVSNLGLSMLNTPFNSMQGFLEVPIYIMPLILIGFIAKTANIPLHFWLPSAHSSAPSPGSAALSGLMVSLGYYGLYRILGIAKIDHQREIIAYAFLVLALFTLIYGGLQSINQRDVKKMLAYSTIATNGYVSLLFAMHVFYPSTVTWWAFILGILMHAAYKTTLFCEAGLIEIAYGTRYIHGVRGIIKDMPLSTFGGVLATLSLLGLPGTVGFLSKLLAFLVALTLITMNSFFATATVISIMSYVILSALIALRYARVYFGASSLKTFTSTRAIPRGIQTPVMLMGLTNSAFALLVLQQFSLEIGLLLIAALAFSIMALYIVYSYFKAYSVRVTS
ncbi:MAG: proton-conducting transporter membrane subunit [Desulfurococcaceae archaeon]